jgi:GTP cyclohydrolase I
MTQPQAPDIATHKLQHAVPLDWVGMCGIALPCNGRAHLSANRRRRQPGDGSSRGIHMSRLYLALEVIEHQPLTCR